MYCTSCKRGFSSEHNHCPQCGQPLKATMLEEVMRDSNLKENIKITNNEEITSSPIKTPIMDYQLKNEEQKQRVFNSNPESEWLKYLILSIICLICCNQIAGIICGVFAYLANEEHKKGKYREYRRKLNISKWGLVVGVLFTLVLIMLNAWLRDFILNMLI